MPTELLSVFILYYIKHCNELQSFVKRQSFLVQFFLSRKQNVHNS